MKMDVCEGRYVFQDLSACASGHSHIRTHLAEEPHALVGFALVGIEKTIRNIRALVLGLRGHLDLLLRTASFALVFAWSSEKSWFSGWAGRITTNDRLRRQQKRRSTQLTKDAAVNFRFWPFEHSILTGQRAETVRFLNAKMNWATSVGRIVCPFCRLSHTFW